MAQSSPSDIDAHARLLPAEVLFETLPVGLQNVLVLLYDRTPDAWVDAWGRERTATPTRHVLADACEFTRSAAASDPNPQNARGITPDVFEHDSSFEADLATTANYLEGWAAATGDTVVVVDSLAWLFGHGSRDAVQTFLADVTELVRGTDISVYVVEGNLSADARETVEPLFETPSESGADTGLQDRLADIGGDRGVRSLRTELHERIGQLHEENPTNYGYLKRNWDDAKRGIEATDRSYPTARQIHAELSDAESTPRTLGPALKAFETLNVIGVWDETVAANRYDLTQYDERRAAVLGELLEACD